jgi:hypothetical protein
MWKTAAHVFCGCLAALPLIGCAGNFATPRQGAAVAPPAVAEPAPYAPGPRIYAVGPPTPAAMLVLLPGDDGLARDPALWAAQGFEVVMPQPADLVRLVFDQQAAMERLLASAEALANAPVWVVGPGPLIEAALAAPRFGRGVSGVVMTSVAAGRGSCSESFFYEDTGTGAPPKVEVRRSGDCGVGTPGRQPSALPTPRLKQPRLIEASAVGKDLPPAAKVHRLAELIKSAPPG